MHRRSVIYRAGEFANVVSLVMLVHNVTAAGDLNRGAGLEQRDVPVQRRGSECATGKDSDWRGVVQGRSCAAVGISRI